MPRILRILNRFNLGGPTYNAAYLTKYMPSHYETMLIGGPNDPTEKNSEFIVNNLGVEPHIIPEMYREVSFRQDYIAFQKIKSIIRDFKPDIVHTHASKAGALGRHAALSMKVPIIVHTFHGHVFDAYFGKLKTSFYKNIERYLASQTHQIIAISEKQKEDLSVKYRICPENKITVIPLGFDLSHFREDQERKRIAFRQQYQVADHEIAIGIIGRLVPIKNHQMFLEALDIVRKKSNQPIRAFIIGDGESYESITRKAAQLGIDYVNGKEAFRPATLTFTSWITEMDKVNAGLDIVALTSLNEGTPVSLIEAQAAGKPIVSTNVGGIENVVIPNQTALLAGQNNPEVFAQKLLQLCNNPILRQEFARQGWQHVAQKYHYTRLVNDMDMLYTRLMEQHAPSVAPAWQAVTV